MGAGYHYQPTDDNFAPHNDRPTHDNFPSVKLPKVSCLCPTFARVALLEEAIESFLKQDYPGEKELIVLNDFTVQNLTFEHPEVKVHNLSERATSLGEKRHKTAELATGEYFMTWGDDDIHLPWRISRMVEAVKREAKPLVLEGWHYVTQEDGIFLNRWSTCGAHIVARELYEKVGGIPYLNAGEDVEFNRISQRVVGAPIPYATSAPAFVYRWHGTRRPHVSGIGPEKPYARMLERARAHVREGEEPSGEVVLKPVWRDNYLALPTKAVVR